MLFVGAALCAVTVFAIRTWLAPDGGWDAWMIWNLRARWLLRAPDLDQAFPAALPVTHPDYPILLPGLVATGWHLLGQEAAWVPALIAAAFSAACVALLTVEVARIRGTAWGALAGAMLLSTPAFVWAAPAQCADVPLGTFILAAAVLLLEVQADREGRRTRLHLWCGVMLSLAALTKNEGLVYLVAFGTAVVLIGEGAPRWKDGAFLLFGALPGLIDLAWFKLRFAPRGEFLQDGVGALLRRVIDPGRWWLAAIHLLRRLVYVQGWMLFLIAVPFAIWVIARGPTLSPNIRRIAFGIVGALLLLCAAYVVTPQDIAWHVDNSFDRLMLQAWPTVLLLLFVSLPGATTSRSR
jgi:hypothetical protein